MKIKTVFVGLMLLVSCIVYGQQKNSSQSHKTDVHTLEETVSLLQAENHAIKKQLDCLQNEIDYYRGDVRAKLADFNDDLSQWLTIMAIMMAVVGIAIPIIINYRNEKSMEKMLFDVSNQASEATQQAIRAQKSVSAIDDIKKHIDKIEKTIKEDKLAAELAAKNAQSSQLFAQALSEKDASKAIELYKKAIDYNPKFSEAYNNRGILKAEMGDTEGAKQDYDNAIRCDQKNAAAYNNRGNLKNGIGDKHGAMKDYDKSIELDPKYAIAYNNRGKLKSDMGDNEGAMKDYDKAIELDPNNAMIYCNRGSFKSKLGDNENAIKDQLKAIVIDPNYVPAYNNLAMALLGVGRLIEALTNVNKSIDKDENNHYYHDTKGQIYMAMEKHECALQEFDFALAINDRYIDALENRAKCYRKLAEMEGDTNRKTELIAKAEVDEKKAESLKKMEKNNAFSPSY